MRNKKAIIKTAIKPKEQKNWLQEAIDTLEIYDSNIQLRTNSIHKNVKDIGILCENIRKKIWTNEKSESKTNIVWMLTKIEEANQNIQNSLNISPRFIVNNSATEIVLVTFFLLLPFAGAIVLQEYWVSKESVNNFIIFPFLIVIIGYFLAKYDSREFQKRPKASRVWLLIVWIIMISLFLLSIYLSK